MPSTVPAVPPAFPRRLPLTADAAIAAALVVLGQWQVWGGWQDGGIGTPPHGDRLARAAMVVWFAAPLAWRRRRPLPVAAVICAGIAVQLLAVAPYVPFLVGLVPMAVANYTAAAYGGRLRLASLALVLLVESLVYARIPAERLSGEVLFGVFVALGTWLIGDVVRTRARHAQRALGDAQVLLARSEAAAAEALAEERTRIARELHDVVAHTVSLMGVQAGAARTLLDHDVEAARTALLEVESAARSSVAELQRLLALLRQDEGTSAERSPQPGLGRLDELVAQVRSAGLEVTLDTETAPVDVLPAGLDLAAFRIVQEALTNALKHAGTATRVQVVCADGRLRIEVENAAPRDGTGRRPVVAGAGHGVVGMRERVQLYGGDLHASATPEGGFLVRAVLPLAPEPALPALGGVA